MIRSMQKASPSTSARATSDMNPALPSINLVLSTWCRPVAAFSSSSASSMSSLSTISTAAWVALLLFSVLVFCAQTAVASMAIHAISPQTISCFVFIVNSCVLYFLFLFIPYFICTFIADWAGSCPAASSPCPFSGGKVSNNSSSLQIISPFNKSRAVIFNYFKFPTPGFASSIRMVMLALRQAPQKKNRC